MYLNDRELGLSDERLLATGDDIGPIFDLSSTLYTFTIEWIGGCTSTIEKFIVGAPIPDTNCPDLLKSTYHDCKFSPFSSRVDAGQTDSNIHQWQVTIKGAVVPLTWDI